MSVNGFLDDSGSEEKGKGELATEAAAGCIPHFAFGMQFRRNRILVLVDGG